MFIIKNNDKSSKVKKNRFGLRLTSLNLFVDFVERENKYCVRKKSIPSRLQSINNTLVVSN